MLFSLLFTGDFAPFGKYEQLVLKKGPEIFGDLQEDIARADLSFFNLETPLSANGRPIEKDGPNFRAHPDCIKAAAEAGFDIAGLANNHIMDFGETGLTDTIKTCKNIGLLICGAGQSLAEAQAIQIIRKKGFKIAFIAVAEHEFSISEPDRPGAAPLDPIENTLQIEQARTMADLVFITIHGGNEYFPFPRPGLRKICRFYIDRGADAVICHHPHVPGAYEYYNDKLIFYSLGNLILEPLGNRPRGWNHGYALRLEYGVKGKHLFAHEIIPYTQSVDQGGVRKMRGDAKHAYLKLLKGYRDTLLDEKEYARVWAEFCEKQKKSVLMRQYFPVKIRGLDIFSRIINPARLFLPTKSTRNEKLNLLRCESHLELLQEVLKREQNSCK
jgi:poly-gamma-glutamate capsule biosynthesis protein CapA/YwtB (metallophosphatase superfamily)